MPYTYGYLREATLAHLDIDEQEAQSQNLLRRFHIFANEAMQAVCSSKPMYQYIDITVVDEFAPLVMQDGAFLVPATEEQINWDIETLGTPDFKFANDEITGDYYHERNIYKKGETLTMRDNFLSFANKKMIKIVKEKNPITCKEQMVTQDIEVDHDLSFIGKNAVKFYKPGEYLIPARFTWFRFQSDTQDEDEIDMPTDIFLTIPLYIASICYQIDNMKKAQVIRQEFETALARCVATDFMNVPQLKYDW